MRKKVLFLWGIGAVLTISVAAAQEHLAVCSKCPSPTVTSTSGLGTANATAEAVMTREEISGWCENWEPGDIHGCLEREKAQVGTKYRATADCTKGRITTIDGESFTLAGVWTSDVGRGRTKWRDKTGQIVGQDNASNGLAISQQWEVLCPKTARATASRGKSTPQRAKASTKR